MEGVVVIEEKVVPIKTQSLADLVRLTASTIMPTHGVTYLIKFKYKNKVVLGLLGVFRDYYKYYGIPIFYYYSFDESQNPELLSANYIVLYSGEERFEFSKHPKPGISIPIISLVEKPAFIPDEIE
jgi:hypothetical protein